MQECRNEKAPGIVRQHDPRRKIKPQNLTVVSMSVDIVYIDRDPFKGFGAVSIFLVPPICDRRLEID